MFNRGQKVSRLLSKYEGKQVIIAIDELLSPVFEKKPKKLRLAERHFCLIKIMENEVNNGGFNSFYFNESGNYASEMYDALEAIGSKEFKSILFESMQAFRGIIPKDQLTRQRYMEDYNDECTAIWEPLNESFYKYEEDMHSLLVDYVREHILEFR